MDCAISRAPGYYMALPTASLNLRCADTRTSSVSNIRRTTAVQQDLKEEPEANNTAVVVLQNEYKYDSRDGHRCKPLALTMPPKFMGALGCGSLPLLSSMALSSMILARAAVGLRADNLGIWCSTILEGFIR